MKKKLLSLVLAGAMVATTSVSAFASPNVTAQDNTEPTTNVQITGNVLNNSGDEPIGTFKVTVPTATSFTVNEKGKFIAPSAITIQNGGDQNIDVFADSFIDTNPTGGIAAVKESDLKSHDRTNVYLKVGGNMGSAFLRSEKGTNQKGLYSSSSTDDQTGDFLLSTIEAGKESSLTLTGAAGEDNSSLSEDVKRDGIKDTFTLRLKIKKSTK